MYLQCYTAQEIAEVVGLSQPQIAEEIGLLSEMEVASKTYKDANFQDDFQTPI
jgi:DNA-binding transcriptional regulator GbsR (MarR family)